MNATQSEFSDRLSSPQWELSCISSCTPRDPLQGMQLHQLFLPRHILWAQQSTSTIHHLVTSSSPFLVDPGRGPIYGSMSLSVVVTQRILGNPRQCKNLQCANVQMAPADLVVKSATNACGASLIINIWTGSVVPLAMLSREPGN